MFTEPKWWSHIAILRSDNLKAITAWNWGKVLIKSLFLNRRACSYDLVLSRLSILFDFIRKHVLQWTPIKGIDKTMKTIQLKQWIGACFSNLKKLIYWLFLVWMKWFCNNQIQMFILMVNIYSFKLRSNQDLCPLLQKWTSLQTKPSAWERI